MSESGPSEDGPRPKARKRSGSVRRGAVARQDRSTRKAAPTPAAARRRLAREDERQRLEAEDAKHRRTRQRVLIGSVVTVGVVGIAAAGYVAQRSTTAHCVDADQKPVSATYCDRGTPSGTFILFNGSQYHYYYGGSVSNGQYRGGSVAAPKSGAIKTDSGRTIRRGGFGGRLGHGTS